MAIVLVGMIYLGMRSKSDDKRDPTLAAQLATQEQQEKAYGAAPFEPYVASPGGVAISSTLPSGPANPLVTHGRAIFEVHGCAACHGTAGVGGPAAPALIGVAAKLPGEQLRNLLLHPSVAMNVGHMPAVDISVADMSALLAYLEVLGTPAANEPASPGHPSAEASAAAATVARTAGPPQPGTLVASHTAIAGQLIFAQRGCAACHGAAGEGGRLPAMASLISGRSDAQVLQALQLPNAKMKAGGMQAVTGSVADLGSIVAYLRTLGGAPLAESKTAPEAANTPASTPAAPMTESVSAPASASPVAAAAAIAAQPVKAEPGHEVFVSQGCAACHGVNAGGTRFAPTLVGISAKFPGDALSSLLHHPNAKMKAGGMPPVTANSAEMKQLLAYLATLDVAHAKPQPASGLGSGQMAPATSSSAAQTSIPPQAAAAKPLSALAMQGSRVFEHYSCQTCHGDGGLNGTAAAPGLAGTASILSAATLENLLRHHSVQMKNGNMPATNMNSNDMKAVIAFIRSIPPTLTPQ